MRRAGSSWVLSEPVVEGLHRVIQEFPGHLEGVEASLAPFKGRFTRWPIPE